MRPREEEVNLDDVRAVFDDIEVGISFFCSLDYSFSTWPKRFSDAGLPIFHFCHVTINGCY